MKPFDFALKGVKFSNKVGSNICGEGSFLNAALYKNENYREKKEASGHAQCAESLYFCCFLSFLLLFFVSSQDPHFKWGFDFYPSGVFPGFRLRRGLATPFLLVAF